MASPSGLRDQIEQAWHLLTVLLQIGRPARAHEIASRCAVLAVAPAAAVVDLVELLCGIPGSPLLLTGDGCITVSETAIRVFAEFVSNAVRSAVPRAPIRVSLPRREWNDVLLIYSRKRKRRSSGEDLQVAKKRLLMSVEDSRGSGNYGIKALSLVNGTTNLTKVSLEAADSFVKEDLATDNAALSLKADMAVLSSQPSVLPLFLSSSSFGSEKIDAKLEGQNVNKLYENPHAILVNKEELAMAYKTDDGFLGIGRCNGIDEGTANIQDVSKHNGGPTTVNTEINYCNENSCFSQENKVLLTVSYSSGSEKNRNAQPTGVSLESSHVEGPTENAAKFDVVYFKRRGPPTGTGTGTGTSRSLPGKFASEGNTLRRSPVGKFSSSIHYNRRRPSLTAEGTTSKLATAAGSLSVEPASVQKQQMKSPEKSKTMGEPVLRAGSQSSRCILYNVRDKNPLELEQSKREEKDTEVQQKLKRNCSHNLPPKELKLRVTEEIKGDVVSKIPKTSELKSLPNFESFVIEEEEGSGGYGTVYRAQRKVDGKIFAIKCPHVNAHFRHVNNEMKMLERFGGKNFVIKYEGSFKSGDAECFILEHIEHDRPELLKKGIDVFELQWYGYCMFRALASLHKQGIVHRDVKPGNFLFSRKLNKGYLIDFNLANDLHCKYWKTGKVETKSNMNLASFSLSTTKPAALNQSRKADKASNPIDNPKKHLTSKNMKKTSTRGQGENLFTIENKRKHGSQTADGSGVTSAKDPTSTRTPSGDRLKQPLPCKGRKELINFVQEAMQSPNQDAVSATFPASHRKRIAAPPGKADGRLPILTPMPLCSGGSAIAGSGTSKRIGNGKQKRVGPCVGTKGFRAPEVLLKSFHQGCKVDIWSAGVTLLYLMIGRSPFGGDPEQNIKEIAKLRGSEALWEVAKLHDCESAFPPELLDVQSLQSMGLRDWCAASTRRPEFLELIPRSLFDLVDKCLTVNPRLRITAEEALMHGFFAPCHESLRKQRQLRIAAGSQYINQNS